MFLTEPPPSAWDLRFHLGRIPVRIHPGFWLAAVVLTANGLLNAPNAQVMLLLLFSWTAAFLFGILAHELGHALAMRAYGRAPQITLYGFGGMTSSGYERLYDSRGFSVLGQIFISAAGPVAGFLLAAVVVLLCVLSGHPVAFQVGGIYGFSIAVEPFASPMLWLFVNDLLYISVFWGLINLLPIYPLDGGQIAREVLLGVNPRDGIRQSLWLSTGAAGALAIVGFVLWRDLLVTVFFGYLAYSSYVALQAYEGRR